MAAKRSPKGKGKAYARTTMLASVQNRRLSSHLDHIQGFILEYISGLVWIHSVCGTNIERAWDLFHDIIFLDPVTTRHFSQFQLIWPHRRSRCSSCREWWAAFHLYMGQMYDQTGGQMSSWRWDNPCTLGDQVVRSIQQTTSSENVQCTDECFSWSGSDDLRAKIEPPCCWQYKPGDFMAVRPLNRD